MGWRGGLGSMGFHHPDTHIKLPFLLEVSVLLYIDFTVFLLYHPPTCLSVCLLEPSLPWGAFSRFAAWDAFTMLHFTHTHTHTHHVTLGCPWLSNCRVPVWDCQIHRCTQVLGQTKSLRKNAKFGWLHERHTSLKESCQTIKAVQFIWFFLYLFRVF